MAGLDTLPPDGVSLHRMDADEFLAFRESLPSEIAKRLELWDGVIIEMAHEGALHMRLVQRTTLALIDLITAQGLRDRFVLSPGGTMVLDSRFVLQPDVMILPALDGKTLPGPPQVELAVEASVTSLRYDLGAKRSKYAERGIRELWILDGEAGVLNCYRAPKGDHFTDETRFRPGDVIAPLFAPGAPIAVADLF